MAKSKKFPFPPTTPGTGTPAPGMPAPGGKPSFPPMKPKAPGKGKPSGK